MEIIKTMKYLTEEPSLIETQDAHILPPTPQLTPCSSTSEDDSVFKVPKPRRPSAFKPFKRATQLNLAYQ